MKNVNQFAVGLLVMLVAGGASAADWGGKEVQVSSNAALETFQADKGPSVFLNVSGISVEVTAQKNAAKVKVAYAENGSVKSQSYFCHTHGDAIDCH